MKNCHGNLILPWSLHRLVKLQNSCQSLSIIHQEMHCLWFVIHSFSHVLSHGNIVWANTSPYKLKPLFVTRCLRYCTNSHYLAHSKSLFRQLNTLNIYSLNKYQNAVCVFKVLKVMHRHLLPLCSKLTLKFINSYTAGILINTTHATIGKIYRAHSKEFTSISCHTICLPEILKDKS